MVGYSSSVMSTSHRKGGGEAAGGAIEADEGDGDEGGDGGMAEGFEGLEGGGSAVEEVGEMNAGELAVDAAWEGQGGGELGR